MRLGGAGGKLRAVRGGIQRVHTHLRDCEAANGWESENGISDICTDVPHMYQSAVNTGCAARGQHKARRVPAGGRAAHVARWNGEVSGDVPRQFHRTALT